MLMNFFDICWTGCIQSYWNMPNEVIAAVRPLYQEYLVDNFAVRFDTVDNVFAMISTIKVQ
jgi:hypothetical protein